MTEPTALAELENQVNDVINRMRRAVEDHESGDDAVRVENHPKFKEMSKRLGVAIEHFRKTMGDDERAPGQGAPTALAKTPEDVLASPTAGAEPRYAVQHDGRGDPIERAHPSPPSEAAGRRAEDEPRDDRRDARSRK